jgi:hypothetical protein
MKAKAKFSEMGVMLLNSFGSDADHPDVSVPINIQDNMKALSINLKKTDTAIFRA